MKALHSRTSSGAKVYLYVPIYFKEKKYKAWKHIVDSLIGKLMVLTLFKVPKALNLYTNYARNEMNAGYSGLSPHEAPIAEDDLMLLLDPYFELKAFDAVHMNALNFAMQSMLFKPFYRRLICPLVNLISWTDQRLLDGDWSGLSSDNRFVLCAIKLQQRQRRD